MNNKIIEVHYYHHRDVHFETAIINRLDRLENLIKFLISKQKDMSVTLADVASAQAAEDIQIEALLAGYNTTLGELKDALANNDQATMLSLITDAQEKTAKIQAVLNPPVVTPDPPVVTDPGTPVDTTPVTDAPAS